MTRVVVNRKAITDHLRTAEPQTALDETAKTIMAAVVEASPKAQHAGKHFKDRWRIRRYAFSRRIYNTDAFGHLIEWGSQNNIAYAPVRRTVRSLGLRLKEASKRG